MYNTINTHTQPLLLVGEAVKTNWYMQNNTDRTKQKFELIWTKIPYITFSPTEPQNKNKKALL